MAQMFLYFTLLLAASASMAEYKTAMDNILAVNTKIAEEREQAGYTTYDDDLTFEGDIGFNDKTIHQLQYEYKKAMGTDTAYDAANNWGFWSQATVPYVIDRSLQRVPQAMNAIRAAIDVYNRNTCIRLVPRSNQRDYVWMNLNPNRGCWSWIGRQGGGQELSLNWGCHSTGTAVHEIMHAIGFFHEQARLDRDNWVNIHWNNIPSNQKYNFQMYRRGQATTYGFPYDKRSIMHYSRFSFPINRRYPTITAKSNYNEELGGNQLTTTDIAQINRHYSCKRSYSVGFHPFNLSKECSDAFGSKTCAHSKSYCNFPPVINVCRKTCGRC